MTLPKYLAIGAVSLLIGLWVGRALTPSRIEYKDRQVTVERTRELTAEELAGLVRTKVVTTQGPTVVERKIQRVVVAGECREVVEEKTTTGAVATTTDSEAATKASKVASKETARIEVREVTKLVSGSWRLRFAVEGASKLDLKPAAAAEGALRLVSLGPIDVVAGARYDVRPKAVEALVRLELKLP